jgi:hypothetical protein
VRARRVIACVVAMAGLACRERSTPTVKPDDVTPSASPSAGPKKNGRIEGKVLWNGVPPLPFVIPGPPAPAAAPACASGYFDPVVGVGGGLADTLVRVMPGTLPPSPGGATSEVLVSAKACLFTPRIVAVAREGDVTFSNDDPIAHDAHAYDFDDGEKIADLSLAPHGHLTLHPAAIAPLADVLLVRSDARPWMRAMIYVTDPRWSRITGRNGAFVIDDVPPGEHDVQAFHDGGDDMRWQIRHVVVPDDGAPVRVEFTYPRK